MLSNLLSWFCRRSQYFWSCAKFLIALTLLLVFCCWFFLIEMENPEYTLGSVNLNVKFREVSRSGRASGNKNEDDYTYYDAGDDANTEEEGNTATEDTDGADYTNLHTDEDYKDDNLDFYANQGKNFTKVVIGVVCCKNGTGLHYLEQTSLLFKSILISAELYNVTRVDIHVFLEQRHDEEYLLRRLEEMGYPSGYEQVDLNVIVHSALSIIPSKYRRHMIFQKKYKCGYTRFFFPGALPRVDSILYVGVDMIVTGNLLKFWDMFKEMKQDQQMIAASKNFAPPESTTKFGDMDNVDRAVTSIDLPQLPPKGVNSALLLMNLTRLRVYGWEEKFLRAFQDYSKISSRSNQITAQKVMNILFFYNPGLYLTLPCHFNFGSMHCNGNPNRENSCLGKAKNDPYGVQLVHINGPYNFDGGSGKNSVFAPLLRYFHQYNMTRKEKSKDTLMKELIIPVRTSFDRRSKVSRCYGKLNKVLFNNFF